MYKELNSDKAKLVALYISKENEATIKQIKESLDIMYIELYSVLEHLKEKDIVSEVEKETYLIDK